MKDYLPQGSLREKDEVGTIKKAKIERVLGGKASEFYDDKYFQVAQERNKLTDEQVIERKNQPTISVQIEGGYTLQGAESADGKYGEKSTWGRFFKTYGSMPKPGMEVKLICDADGYYSTFLVPK